MAGYFLYSLDTGSVEKFLADPTSDQLTRYAKPLAKSLQKQRDDLEPTDPLHDWPTDAEALTPLVQQRLATIDWYADLSVRGKGLWEGAAFSFLTDKRSRKEFNFRAESDGISFTILEKLHEHFGVAADTVTDRMFTQFGKMPLRCRYRQLDRPSWEDFCDGLVYVPWHGVHSTADAAQLIEELKAAEPTVLADDDAEVEREYAEELLPMLEKIVKKQRLLFVQVDT
ncbi:hypothetical protein [Blastopirellula marina]|nr:hypothetical protein [Blastopirellula marina]